MLRYYERERGNLLQLSYYWKRANQLSRNLQEIAAVATRPRNDGQRGNDLSFVQSMVKIIKLSSGYQPINHMLAPLIVLEFTLEYELIL